MVEVVVAAAAVAAVLALGLTVLAALTLVPFVVALQRAEVLRVSPMRVGALALVASVAGLVLAAFAVLRTSLPVWQAALLVLLTWVVPLALRIVPSAPRQLGRAGRHEAGARR